MRIIFIRSNPVDPDSRVEKEVNTLIKAGYNVEIVAWDRNGNYSLKESYINLEAGKVKINRFGILSSYGGGVKNNLRPLAIFQAKLFLWLCKNKTKYDIIHACDFDTAYTSFRVAKLLKKKFIYDIFDYYVDAFNVPKYLKSYIEKKDQKIINSADGVIICSEKRKKQIIGTNPKRLAIIHNTPANLKMNIKSQKIEGARIKIAYVGILGNGRFIKEIADIVINNSNYELHIGGFGEYEGYFNELSKKHSNIIFYGKLSYKKTLELEDSCDIMTAIYDPIIPNHFFAAPNKFYEALMLGKPLLMIRNTGMSEIVEKESIGELAEYNYDSLEKSLLKLINRKDEWPIIAEKMKRMYKESFSWGAMEKRLLDFYRNI
ncbi:glycosyltransferase family 4 protein [Bacillus sp. AGMB 02131]|uniref:Glycosyltransferase family 4 protein n=1 Tax=Peribacillus faecalis TaxID=2772559 RepID=A0A927CWX7_9BACI|nr:glycosyltransferase family 4 protein [Peribacillus faecalis]MBD3107145.1 glycosyltransferase family 4 protein [Peribacillus faecalis]